MSTKLSAKKTVQTFWNEHRKRIVETNAWSTALLIVSSAALGGIAVALWNRKALTSIRDFGETDPGANQLKLDLSSPNSDKEIY